MQTPLASLLAAVLSWGRLSPLPSSPPAVDCRALDAKADTAGTIVPDFGSGRAVLGRRRVPVYSAPDLACPMAGVYVVRGDQLYAQVEMNGFTRVGISPLHASPTAAGNDFIAWVRTTRVTPNGRGIVPGTHTF